MKRHLSLQFAAALFSFQALAGNIPVADPSDATFRAAIDIADEGDVIVFDPILAGETITLSGSQIFLQKSLTIDASAVPGGVTISGNGMSRIFNITQNTDVTLRNLTLTGGKTPDGAAGQNADGGGAINHAIGKLTLENCHIRGNETGKGGYSTVEDFNFGGNGGGIFTNNGTLIILNSTISENRTGNGGVGEINRAGGGGAGGGLFSLSAVTIVNASITRNATGRGGVGLNGWMAGAGGDGGGVYSYGGSMEIHNSTIANNVAGRDGTAGTGGRVGGSGGGIYSQAPLTLRNVSLSGNEAGGGFDANGQGGGLYFLNSLTLANSIVAGNAVPIGGISRGKDVRYLSGLAVVEGNNFIGDNDTAEEQFPAGPLVGTVDAPLDPGLETLVEEIGATAFLRPLPDSPVLDAGDDAALPSDLLDLDGDLNVSEIYPYDQIGKHRTSGPASDLGAIEIQQAKIAVVGDFARIRRAKAALRQKIQKLSKKLKQAKRKEQIAKGKRFRSAIRRLRANLRALNR